MGLRRWIPFLGVVTAASTGCTGEASLSEAAPGSPLPGLTQAEVRAFATGQALFNRPFTQDEGLGPRFNQDRCGSCHDLPTSGGHGAEPVTKVSRFTELEGCTPLAPHGGDLLREFVTEAGRRAGTGPERVPPQATATSSIRAPAVYGLGLVEAIPERDILARADPGDADGDGISGRPNLDSGGRPGRFGRKAQHTTLASFIEEATRLELGLTTPANPAEASAGGDPLQPSADPAPDPEVDEGFLGGIEDYIRYLAPPVRRLPDSETERADVDEGERIFEFAGCSSCHTPTFTTGDTPSTTLAGRRFRLYSDLLLHDMGPELAGTCTSGTTPSEWKTARLVGLAHRSEYLHDGRAQSVGAAIELHGGEAAASRDVYRRLTPEARDQLLAFLRSL